MKKVTNYVIAALCVGSLAFSAGSFMKVKSEEGEQFTGTGGKENLPRLIGQEKRSAQQS